MGDVVRFFPKNSGDKPDAVLDQAVGEYTSVIVFGRNAKTGTLDARASKNLSMLEVSWMLDQLKRFLLTGDFGNEHDQCNCGDPDCTG